MRLRSRAQLQKAGSQRSYCLSRCYSGRGGQGRVRSLADEKWWEVFQDEQLKELIKTALQQNYDLRIAATRILQARAQLGITRADQFPTIAGSAGAINERTPQTKFLPAFETSATQVGPGLDWDLDFWGKFRRATEAARANLMASEWARREVTHRIDRQCGQRLLPAARARLAA